VAIDATLPLSPPADPRPDPVRGREVRRTRLLRRLATADATDVVLLRAPAGYGKTTLLRQWAAADPRPCAWVAVHDPGSGGEFEAADVAFAIVQGLEAREPFPRELHEALTGPTAVDRRLLRALDAALEQRGPLLLAIDDADLLLGPQATALLALLAARCGRGSTLALAARREPALPLARLRAEDRLLELGAAQLALDAHEAARLLEHADRPVPAAEAAALVARTEGWAAMLALAVQAVGEHESPVGAVALDGADRLVVAYVREQLLAGLDTPTQRLLLRSAPLGTLSGELCDAVLGRIGSGLALRELAHGNMPLTPLDRAERRFRPHPLLAEALLAELRRTDAAWEPEAHRRASAWHERRGDTARAIDHAVAAGDARRTSTLLWPALPAHALGPAPERLDGWLAELGERRVATSPALALAAALRRLAAGRADEAERLATDAADALGEDRGAAPARTRAGVRLIRAALGRHGADRMVADADAALAGGVDQPSWRALAHLLAGAGAHLRGEDAVARERLDEGAWHACSVPLVEALCLAQHALLALDRDRPERAVVLARRAAERVDRTEIAQAPLCALVFATSAFASAQEGALDVARGDLRRAQQLIARAVSLPAWYEAELRFALARTQLRLSDAAGARAQLAHMSRAARRVPDAPTLRTWSEDAWARADAFAATSVRGPARLTLAELRVLRLLPTHFSLREIAARLHVSANTVKTQAHAVYRKLDVSSRSEAVARARAIGLVDGTFR